MPRKKRKNNKFIHIEKEKKILIKNLMEMNIKVDDHVYKNRKISTNDAELYLKEIISYKKRYLQDLQISQVIEKLMRCMKGIIIEENENSNVPITKDASFPKECENTKCSSPIYFTPDEDTQLAQNILDSEMNQTAINKINAKMEIIDLCSDESTENNFTHDLILERSISNLSIKESDDLYKNTPVIGNFDCIQNVEAQESSIKINNQVINNDLNGTVTWANNPPKHDEIIEKSTLIIQNNENDESVQFDNNSLTCNKSFDIKRNIQNEKPKRKHIKKVSKPKSNTKIVKTTNKLKKSNTAVSTHENMILPLTKTNQIQETSTKEIIPNREVSKAYSYSRKTEDLSWVEGIKYVREVTTDEYDNITNLEESFWNNCSWPGNLRDQDFICDFQ